MNSAMRRCIVMLVLFCGCLSAAEQPRLSPATVLSLGRFVGLTDGAVVTHSVRFFGDSYYMLLTKKDGTTPKLIRCGEGLTSCSVWDLPEARWTGAEPLAGGEVALFGPHLKGARITVYSPDGIIARETNADYRAVGVVERSGQIVAIDGKGNCADGHSKVLLSDSARELNARQQGETCGALPIRPSTFARLEGGGYVVPTDEPGVLLVTQPEGGTNWRQQTISLRGEAIAKARGGYPELGEPAPKTGIPRMKVLLTPALAYWNSHIYALHSGIPLQDGALIARYTLDGAETERVHLDLPPAPPGERGFGPQKRVLPQQIAVGDRGLLLTTSAGMAMLFDLNWDKEGEGGTQ